LLIGVPGKSNAFEISRRLGLQDFIIDYAKNLISQENIEFEDVLQAIEKDRKQTEEKRFEVEKLKKEIEALKIDLSQEKNKIGAMKDKIVEKAKEEARVILRAAKEESDLIVSELRDISSDLGKERNKRIQEAQSMLKSKIEEVDRTIGNNILSIKTKEPPKNLRVGETVEVLTLNQKGEVLSLPDESGNLTVQVGIMKVNAHVSTLVRSKSEEREISHTRTKNIIGSKSRTIKKEIDLRGKNIEEAILDLDKYLDDSYIAGLKEVTVIHGKGTGALRAGLKEYFKQHRLVKSSRLGTHGEGGTGVSLVELK